MTEQPFTSKSDCKLTALLSEMLHEVLRVGERTPDDFIAMFPPRTVIKCLGHQAELRARVVSGCTGTSIELAKGLSVDQQVALLETAFTTERAASGDRLLQHLPPDDCAQHLPLEYVWAFCMGTEFWKSDEPRSKALMTAFITSGMRHNVLQADDTLNAIVKGEFPSSFTTEDLWSVIRRTYGHRFYYRDFLDAVTPAVLVARVDTRAFWEQIIYPQIKFWYGDIANMNKPEATNEETRATAETEDATSASPLPRVQFGREPSQRAAIHATPEEKKALVAMSEMSRADYAEREGTAGPSSEK